MNSNNTFPLTLITATFLFWCIGCGSDIERTNVVGQVTLDGQLVDGAVVVFNPTSRDGISVWSVVKEGEFQFSETDGPPPGLYEVVIKPEEPDSEELFEEIRQRNYNLLTKRNSFQAAVDRKGKLQVDLSKEKVNEIKIELTSL